MMKPSCLPALIIALVACTSQAYSQTLFSSKHPLVVINTDDSEIPDEPKIKAKMGIIYHDNSTVNKVTDDFNHYNGFIGIETRGNSTQDFVKKTYSIELRDENNEDISAPLLGMGLEEDWIFHAMVIDKSLLRIPLSFYLWQAKGHYASNWRFVELVINGNYRGLYILTERIKQGKDRVNIKSLKAGDLSGDALTGGYILRIDWLDDPKGFESNYASMSGDPMFFQWYYPRSNKIQPGQAAYMDNWMDEFEDALFSKNCVNHAGKHYSEYLDLNSFVDFLLINELSKNSDGYKLSSYVHKQADSEGGKLVAGPIWDFDQTYGLSDVCSGYNPSGWTFLQNQEGCEDWESMPMWWQALVADTVFRNKLNSRWKQHRNTFLHLDSIYSWIHTHQAFIAEARTRNFKRWPHVIGHSIWNEPEPVPQTYEAEIEQLKSWIAQRIQWLDTHIPTISSEQRFEIGIYPNPVHEYLTIDTDEAVVSRILDLHGRLVLETAEKQIDLTHLAPGVYFLRLELAGDLLCTQKVVKN